MKLVLTLLICFIIVKKLNCATIAANTSSLTNQKQQKLIEETRDLNVNPCYDFYHYACGNWENVHKEAGAKYTGLLDYNVNKEMAHFFNEINLQNEPKYIASAYKYFKSCLDLKEYGTLHYLKWLTEHENMKLPILGTSSEMSDEFDWLRTLAVMRIYGLNDIFITGGVVQRKEDPLKFIIDLDRPLVDEDFIALTLEDFEQLTESFGEHINNVLKLWHEIEAFESELQDIHVFDDEYESEEGSAIDLSLKKVSDLPLPWLKDYIKILLNQTELNPNMEIYLYNKPYFMALDNLLKQYSQDFLCQYLEIRFLWHLYQQLPQNITAEDCVSNVRNILPTAMHWLYEHHHSDLQLEFPKIIEIYENIRKRFNKTIEQNYYRFNETVMEFLFAKVNTMKLKLNNIPRTDTVKTLEHFYDNLDLNINEFYGNHLKLLKFNFIAIRNLLNNTIQKNDFFLEDFEGNGASSSPYYIRRANALVVPITLLQQPIYQPNSADVYKYSALGFLLARSMFYGFNKIERFYYAVVTNPIYDRNFTCIDELGPFDSEESIGASLYYSYHMFNDSRTDGVDDTSLDKLFFLNFVQLFCGTTDTEFDSENDGTDQEIITNVLKHFPEFSKVFQCNSSHSMHPPKECEL